MPVTFDDDSTADPLDLGPTPTLCAFRRSGASVAPFGDDAVNLESSFT